MDRLLDLKFGSFKVPTYLDYYRDEHGFLRVRGRSLIKRHFNLMIDLGFNISVVLADNIAFGSMDENGTYDGLYGLLQQNKVDTILLPGETFMKSPPGKFGPIIHGAENRIMSFTLPPNTTTVDVIESVNVFEKTTYGLVLGAFVVCFMILKLTHLKRPLWALLSSLLSQNFDVPNTGKRRLMYAGFLGFIFLLEEVFNGAYSTDLAVVFGEKLIKTLDDLFKSNQLPWWYAGDSLYTQFKYNTSAIYGKIWSKAVKAGIKKCLIAKTADNLVNLDLSIDHYKTERMALVASSLYKHLIVNYLCNVWGNSYKKQVAQGFRLFYSSPFSTVNYAFLMNFNISQPLEKATDKFSFFGLENGYVIKAVRETGDSLLESSFGPECADTVFDKAESLTEVLPLGFERTAALFNRAFNCILVSVLVALVENIVRRFRNKVKGMPQNVTASLSEEETEEAESDNVSMNN